MSDNELEVDLDQVDVTNEPDTSSQEIDVEEGDDNTTSQKTKNESNFKALYKSNKEKERDLLEKEKKMEEMGLRMKEQAKELEEWRWLNPDVVASSREVKKLEEIESKLFVIDNPNSKAHINQVKETASQFNVPLEMAWKIVKADLPSESKTSDDFDLTTAPVRVKKSLKDITPEEALKLPRDQMAKWQKLVYGID